MNLLFSTYKKITFSLLTTLLCCLLLNNTNSKAQGTATNEHYCGTEMPKYMSDWLDEHQQNPRSYRQSGQIEYIPMQFHIVGTDDGVGYFPATETFRLLCELNEDFLVVGMQFYLNAPFNYLNNDNWYIHNFGQGANMMNTNNFDNCVNVYIVEDPSGACGYFSGGADAVAVAKSCSQAGDNTLTHELGHYLSLPHTFFGWEGAYEGSVLVDPIPQGQWERVDGSNCNTAADRFCDTPPDYVSYRWPCPLSSELADPNGTAFLPDESFYMSYALDACTNRFSQEQMNAMTSFLYEVRTDLLGNPTPEGGEIGEVNIIYPATTSDEVPADNNLICWNAVTGATQYFLSIQQFTDVIDGTNIQTYTTDTFYVANIDPDVTYYVSLVPINDANTCMSPTNINFETSSNTVLSLNTLNVKSPQCSQQNNGFIEVSISGGTPPYSYLWNNDVADAINNNLTEGVYSLTVTDANDLVGVFNINVPEPDQLEASITQTDNFTGQIDITGGSIPYAVEWSSGEISTQAFSLEIGENTVTVTDANGCSVNLSSNIFALQEFVTNPSCNGTNDGNISVEAFSGTEPYEYLWNTGDTTNTIGDLTPGEYELSVTDASNSIAILNYIISEPDPLTGSSNTNSNGLVNIVVAGGTPPYNFFWPTGLTTSPFFDGSILPNGTYTSTVFDANDCSINVEYTVNIIVGINENENQNNILGISPNVVRANNEQYINITTNTSGTNQLVIFNANGQQVWQNTLESIANTTNSYLLPALGSGLYLIKITDETGGNTGVAKLMIVN